MYAIATPWGGGEQLVETIRRSWFRRWVISRSRKGSPGC